MSWRIYWGERDKTRHTLVAAGDERNVNSGVGKGVGSGLDASGEDGENGGSTHFDWIM